MYKCCGIFFLTIICFYLLLYLTDFFDFVIINKRAFELYKKVTKLVVSLLVILKKMFVQDRESFEKLAAIIIFVFNNNISSANISLVNLAVSEFT